MSDTITVDEAVETLSEHFMIKVEHLGQGRFSATCNCSESIRVFAMHENVPRLFGEGTMPIAKEVIGEHLRDVLESTIERTSHGQQQG